ncbi:MAG: insulinase family protein [Proteobacteria bacterium]|nr:insulinase family protein [Pseudomonadota bacterium]
MTRIHGFELLRQQYIPELETEARFFRHVKTGAELLSLSNRDENKVFGISFRTPVADSTGVAHILEHSVLCGSRKYPVKEPFIELLKGSLQTFLNAFTYPDKTCYPVASQNVQDFYNLIDVYLDAVFYPRLTPFIFQQEGWHYELERTDQPLIYKGVVFNEMKGAYSSPDNLLARYSQASVFPAITYGFDSGGDPREIIRLSFEQFRDFHRRYYHPSNARIYFYGDDDPEKRLQLVDEYLKNFARLELDSHIPLQPSLNQPVHSVHPFTSGGGGDSARTKGMLTVNWLLAETSAVDMNLALHIMEYILLGMPASPLRKALIDSGLGEDIAGVGLESELRQLFFSTGLKGIDVSNAQRIETLILDTLKGLVQSGIDPRTVEAAVNTIEFQLRENNSGHFPRGLLLMLRSLSTWLYGGDPLATIAFEAPLERLKSNLANDKRFFEHIIERALVQNRHRATVILKPDPDLEGQEKALEQKLLDDVRAAMSQEELTAILNNTRELKLLQETPDSPEALATIPLLKLSDIDRHNKRVPLQHFEGQEPGIIYHDLFTNGILYLDLGFNLRVLPQTYLPYVPLFGRALLEMGTETEDFVTLVQRISRSTGGIRTSLFTAAAQDSAEGSTWLFLRGKAMRPQVPELLAILQDVVLTVKLDNRERFRQMVLEEKAQQEQKLVPAGSQVVDLRLRAHFSDADWAEEQMKGVSYLFFLRRLADALDSNWPGVLSTLEEMRQSLVAKNAMIANVTLDEKGWSSSEHSVKAFLDVLPKRTLRHATWSPERLADNEGMTIPARVNYVGKGAQLYHLGYAYHGSINAITHYLRTTWLWERVRVQGGAYGARCAFDRLSGVLTFTSYRDPNLLKTIEVFDQAATFLQTTHISDDELSKSIIGAIAAIDAYLLPDAKGYTSLQRYLIGTTDEIRQRIREELLSTTVDHFKAFAEMLGEVKETGLVKVLGSQQAIEEVAAQRPGWLELVKVL